MAIATKFGYRRRSPDVLANALLALALVGVCLVGWEVLAPAQLPALAGRHGPEGRSLLALPLDTSSTTTLFPSPPPPAPKQPKHFTGAEKARSRAAGCSRAPAGPFLRLPQARLSARHRTAFERVAPTPATLSLAVRHARCSPAPGSALVAPALGFMLTRVRLCPPPASSASFSTSAACCTASSASRWCARSTLWPPCLSWATSSTCLTT
jgi:hypothetical protein